MTFLAWDDLPNFGLYMDQLINIVNDSTEAYSERLTPAMVNNYVKKKLVDPPIKKKYQREQIAQLIFINLMKSIFSLEEMIKLDQIFLNKSSLSKSYDNFIRYFKESSLDHDFEISDLSEQLVHILIARKQIKNLLDKNIQEG